MKLKILFSFIAVALGAAFTVFLNGSKEKKEIENKEGPSEHFAFMRSYPDAALDIKAYNNMLRDAKSGLAQARLQNVLSWQQEGPTNIGGRITALAIHPTNQNIIY